MILLGLQLLFTNFLIYSRPLPSSLPKKSKVNSTKVNEMVPHTQVRREKIWARGENYESASPEILYNQLNFLKCLFPGFQKTY